jgi:hypothetical protein
MYPRKTVISMYLFPRRDSAGSWLVRSDAADSSWETVRMKGGQSREVGSKESQRDGVDEQRDARAREG